jgi:hypothetical protein
MKYFLMTRKFTHVEKIIVRAENKSDAKRIAEDDIEDENIFVEYESDDDYEVYYPDIVEDSALNCAEKFAKQDRIRNQK